MAKNGWSHLTVTFTPPASYAGDDGGTFADEQQMLRELGAAGWELVFIRAAGEKLVYYFKRPRS